MRIANHEGRLAAITGEPGQELAHDVEKNSGGRFGPEPQAVYEDWARLHRLAAGARREGGVPVRRPAWARRPRRRARCSASG